MTAAKFAYVGSRTNAMRKANGKGITVYAIEAGGWRLIQTVDVDDPSFLALTRDGTRLYAAQGDGSNVRGFSRDPKTGLLTLKNTQSSHGLNGAHIVIDPSDRFALVANHLTGQGFVSNVAVFPLGADGSIGEASDVHVITGKHGPVRHEQDCARPHQVQFSRNGRFAVMADKGLDEVFVFTLDAAGKLHSTAHSPVRLRPGSAPRHVSFHPALPYLYILTEIDSTIITAHFDDATGKITPFQLVSSLSDEYVPRTAASHIEVSPDGRFVYASNRGQNTIGVFTIDPATGRVTPIQFASTSGKVPRYFAFTPDRRECYAGNEFSDTVVRFSVGEDGRLTPAGVAAETGTPTCILVV